MTERAGHAFDLVASVADEELNAFDGVVAVVCHWRLQRSLLSFFLSLSRHTFWLIFPC